MLVPWTCELAQLKKHEENSSTKGNFPIIHSTEKQTLGPPRFPQGRCYRAVLVYGRCGGSNSPLLAGALVVFWGLGLREEGIVNPELSKLHPRYLNQPPHAQQRAGRVGGGRDLLVGEYEVGASPGVARRVSGGQVGQGQTHVPST